jgi:hypothetical protein
MAPVKPLDFPLFALAAAPVEVTTPFLVLAERKGDRVRVKYRMGEW